MIEEQTLVQRLKHKSTQEQAFRDLISQYKERLYWHIRKIVISHEDADDVLQNTFIKVYKNINKFNAKSKIYSWMYRIATNEAISFINKKAKKKQVDITEYNQFITNSLQDDTLYDGNEIQLVLQQAIATLPQKQQLVFNMKYFDEIKYSDMSDILGTSVGALKASYFHAVKKIEEIIKSH